ncbi:hypothetical protein Anapl_12520 [Anas platyrhynchos]|uniref:Uncharacterized protein n=1 Tax=Anas platyrhynchos TaxID=8839 RepID=R0KK75_ANAPL|nr:hypothetical protein Anapl_12520 [Anas platyrhynchos]
MPRLRSLGRMKASQDAQRAYYKVALLGIQQTGNNQFKRCFLDGASHGAPRYPPQGFPEMFPSLAKPSLSLFAFRMPADLWASRGIWKMLSPDECRRSPGSVEKRSHLSMVRNGNSHGDSSHRLSGHLL